MIKFLRDEVLRSLLKYMVTLYNENFNENLDVNDVKDFVVENSFPKIYETTGRVSHREIAFGYSYIKT